MDAETPFILAILSVFDYLKMAFLAENLRLWMGATFAPFNIDDSTFSLVTWSAVIGLAGLFACAMHVHHMSCKSFPSVQSLVPRTAPAASTSVGNAWCAVRLLRQGIVTRFYGSSAYGSCRKVVDWILPDAPEVFIMRMFLLLVLGPILSSKLASPYSYLKGMIAGFLATEQYVPLKCRRLENIYNSLGYHQSVEDRRAFYFCAGEQHGFDLQDMWEEAQEHPCLNGDIFHVAALVLAAVLIVAFWLGIYIHAVASTPGSSPQVAAVEGRPVECNGSPTVPQVYPGRVQETEDLIPEKLLLKPASNPRVKALISEPDFNAPSAKSPLKAPLGDRSGERSEVPWKAPRWPTAAAFPTSPVQQVDRRLSQKLKEAEDQLLTQLTMRQLAEARLVYLQELAGIVADKSTHWAVEEFNRLARACTSVAGDDNYELYYVRGISNFDIPQLLQRARTATFEGRAKTARERIESSVVEKELKRELKSANETIQSLRAELSNRPVQQPADELAKLASTKHQLEVDALRAQYNEDLDGYLTRIQDLEETIRAYEAEAREEVEVWRQEFAKLHHAKDKYRRVSEEQVQKIAGQAQEIADKDQTIQRAEEYVKTLQSGRDELEGRVKSATALAESVQTAYQGVVDDRARLQKEKDAESQRHAGERQELASQQEVARAKATDNQLRVNELLEERDRLQAENKKLRKKPQVGPSPELAAARVKIIEHEAEIKTLKDRLQQVQTPTDEGRMKQVVEGLRVKARALEGEKTELLIRHSKKVRDLEEQLRQKSIALSNASAQGRALANP
ncbi:hypothetical protein FQN54_001626 [Arachnomyces sp. PD_36]|nr:hypothetical protein FQN54_001626 [Arachnomyces sp. PD_36]